MSTPDGAQSGSSGKGVLIFDIDDGHRFVRRIEIPFKEGLRGFCGSVKNHAVYYSSTIASSARLIWRPKKFCGNEILKLELIVRASHRIDRKSVV